MIQPSFGFLGAGKMASALVRGVLEAGLVKPEQIAIFDAVPAQTARLAEAFGVRVVDSAAELYASSTSVFLCVKPTDAAEALAATGGTFGDRILISIAAGLTLDWLLEQTSATAKICRAMPNTAAEVRQSATAICFSESVNSGERDLVQGAFAAVGEVFPLDEKHFDAVVGVSGSGPAYACLLMEAMSDGGTRAGLPRATATRLAALTLRGAASLVLETNTHPAVLREAVSSPGGTTLAALSELEAGAVRSHAANAVLAAAQRSRELANG